MPLVIGGGCMNTVVTAALTATTPTSPAAAAFRDAPHGAVSDGARCCTRRTHIAQRTDLVEMGALQHRRAVDQLNALHYMHTNMLRMPLMHVVDSRDVQASVAPT